MQTQSPSESNQPPNSGVNPQAHSCPLESTSESSPETRNGEGLPLHRRLAASLLTAITKGANKQVILAQIHKSEGEGTEGLPTYMERFTLYRSRQFGIYLQHIVGAPSPQFHDHPWHMIALVLSGSYRERYLTPGLSERERAVRWFNRQKPNSFHTLVSAAPDTWVLVITQRQLKPRGFLAGVVGDQAEYVIPSPIAEEVPENERLVV